MLLRGTSFPATATVRCFFLDGCSLAPIPHPGASSQAVEVLSLVALLYRARHQPLLSPSNATTMMGCLSGTLTAAAWGLLPRRRWEALVNAVKVGGGALI